MRCRWTDMNALHYAVYFDSPEVIEVLADHNPSLVMSVCSEFNGGNGLHIAANNMALSSAQVLVSVIDASAIPYSRIFSRSKYSRLAVLVHFVENNFVDHCNGWFRNWTILTQVIGSQS